MLWALAVGLTASSARADEPEEVTVRPGVFAEHGWRVVPLAQMLEQSQRQSIGSRGMPRMLPLAMMPLPHSALWLGVSASRSSASGERNLQVELRWSIPLDRIGGQIEVRKLLPR